MKPKTRYKFLLVGILCFLFGVILSYLYFSITSPQLTPASDTKYFSHLHSELNSAKESIHVVMFQMRYYPQYEESRANLLLQDLANAKQKGLEVKVILEGGEAFLGGDFQEKQKKACQYLQNSGIEVKFDPEGITTHAKLLIIDKEKVFLGSNNWNYYSLEKNKETSALIQSSKFAQEYENYFQNLWKVSSEAHCKILPWKNCSSVAEILSRRYECDKRTVSINGTASNLKFKTSQAGNEYAIFQLNSHNKSLKVFTFGHPDISKNNFVGVKGTYYREKEVSGYTYYDEVEADEIERIEN